MWIKKIFSYCKKINILKTIYYNFKLFPFKHAIKLPLFIYRKTNVKFGKDNIHITGEISSGMIKIGIPLTHFVDPNEKTIIISNGIIELKGKCDIGSGSKIAISKSGYLKIGSNFNVTGSLRICCEHYIKIDDDCMFSWDVSLLDTDYHPIKDIENKIINSPRPIKIGKHVWIGCNCIILKGVTIADNSIISAGSIVKKGLDSTNTVYGMPSNILQPLKCGVLWTKDIF